MNTAIIVAAGSGNRFGGKTPKQFIEIGGKPLIIHTLEPFQACPDVDQIILVLPSETNSDFLNTTARCGISKLAQIITGGKTRAGSVRNGLKAVNPADAEIIAVHDGARPLVTHLEISNCIEKARESGSAILVAPVTDTIKEVKDGRIVQTIDRSNLRRALTPQCFRYEILRNAFDSVDELTESATDESFLIERTGREVSIVEGSAKNIKVTTKEDLKFVEKLLKEKYV